ncbi:hypothetical protein DPMN_180628 [Dreissena polymorpha]|uniref:Uncharacterized protein n=1 Tax=Dreissena polymorpha TaxID=45954 RepID=A0A9D4INB9_DREPO|nr:hypothetical protein DPMN_180628 [Dreissena polymorpha]
MVYLSAAYVPILRADFPSKNGKSRADAEAACNSTIDQNPIVQQCVLRAGLDFAPENGNCVEDFKADYINCCYRLLIYKAVTICLLIIEMM